MLFDCSFKHSDFILDPGAPEQFFPSYSDDIISGLGTFKSFPSYIKMPIGKVFLLGGFPRKVATGTSLRILKYLRDRYSCESAFWTKYDKLRSESAVSILLDEHVLWLYCTMIILTNDAPYFKYKCTSSVSRTTR